MSTTTRVAILHDAFFGPRAEERLLEKLQEAKGKGASIAVLPELPLDRWIPNSKERKDEDAEDADGPRQKMLTRCALAAGIAVLGGAIVRSETVPNVRHNTAVLVDTLGTLVCQYRKVHVPEEPGYWEGSQYEAGVLPPPCLSLPHANLKVGIQLCSDVMRLTGWQMLAAQGVEVILVPRATPVESYERWKMVLCTMAVTCAAYVISTNRPEEVGTMNGGASFAVRPNGDVILETSEKGSVAVIDCAPADVQAAKTDYPGYLAYPSKVYEEGWKHIDSVPRGTMPTCN